MAWSARGSLNVLKPKKETKIGYFNYLTILTGRSVRSWIKLGSQVSSTLDQEAERDVNLYKVL